MSTFDNPFGRDSSIDRSESVAAIKLWTRQSLARTEVTILSANLAALSQPAQET
jgi:hypothetical protein